MLRLVQFFFELCLLRRAPQDLPASSALLGVTLLTDLSMGVTLADAAGLAPGLGLIQSLVDIAFMLALLYGALYISDRLPRFQQSATALLGSGALLAFIAVVPLSLLQPTSGEHAVGGGLLFLAIVGWSVLVTGHILRHTFELRLGQGIGIALIYSLFAYSLLEGLFSGA